MENNDSPELIQERMLQTRNALTDKVVKLEEQVLGTMQTATDAVQSTVETVKDTVDNVRLTMEDTMSSVKETVRQTFDISGHVQERPWLMLGAAVATGFAMGRFAFGRSGPSHKPVEAAAPPLFREPPPAPQPVAATPREPSWLDKLMTRAGNELYKLGEQAMEQAMDSLKHTVHEGVPKLMSEVEDRIVGAVHSPRHGNGHPKVMA